MRILVISQYYYPEPFRINDLCEDLVNRGHQVIVVTGEPNYPEGEIYNGYEDGKKADEILNGVMVHRCHIIPRKKGALYRLLNYFSYPWQAKKYIKELIKNHEKDFDVVFIYQLSPVIMAKPALFYKKKCNVPVLLYCLDLWPESLIVGGIKKKSLVYKYFHRISKNIYKSADRILITSKLFRGYLKEEFEIDDEAIDYQPQYAEEPFRDIHFGEKKEEIDLVFAGNIGIAQSVETILEAAEILKRHPVHIHIVGGGSELNCLKKLAEEKSLTNVTFYGRRPLKEMMTFYAKADAMLVTLQANPILSLTLPGKVQSYMAAGKPIIGAANGETAEIIKKAQCGICGAAEDSKALAQNICSFLACNEKKTMGANARLFYEKYFKKDVFMDRLEKELKLLMKR